MLPNDPLKRLMGEANRPRGQYHLNREIRALAPDPNQTDTSVVKHFHLQP